MAMRIISGSARGTKLFTLNGKYSIIVIERKVITLIEFTKLILYKIK